MLDYTQAEVRVMGLRTRNGTDCAGCGKLMAHCVYWQVGYDLRVGAPDLGTQRRVYGLAIAQARSQHQGW